MIICRRTELHKKCYYLYTKYKTQKNNDEVESESIKYNNTIIRTKVYKKRTYNNLQLKPINPLSTDVTYM